MQSDVPVNCKLIHGSANDKATVVLATSVVCCWVKITYRVCLLESDSVLTLHFFDCSIAGDACHNSDKVRPCLDM